MQCKNERRRPARGASVQLARIEGSSSVDSAGFDAGVIRVLFRSGHWKDFPGRTAGDFEELLAAPSKGRFVRERLGPGGSTTITGPTFLTPLDTFQDDECCSGRLSKAIAAGKVGNTWECPKCGVEWGADPVPGLGRHWKPRSWVARF